MPASFFDYVQIDFTSLLFVIIVIEFGFLWLIKPISRDKEEPENEQTMQKNIIRLRDEIEDVEDAEELELKQIDISSPVKQQKMVKNE